LNEPQRLVTRRRSIAVSFDYLKRDLKYAFRTIARARVFAAIAVVSLALGIGANTAIFSLVSGLLFNKPGVARSAELIEIHRLLPDGSYNAVSQHDLEDIREALGGQLAGLSAYELFTGQIGGADGAGTVVLGELVNAEFFRTLGVPITVGRAFLPEEDRVPLANPVIVLGDRFWRTHYRADPSVVGSIVRLNGRSYTVVGVAPPGFSSHTGGIRVDVWAPLKMQGHLSPSEPEWNNLFTIARLARGTSPAALRQALGSLAARLDPVRGRTDRRWQYSVTRLDDILFTPSFDGALKAIAALLLAVVALVLVVTCSNLAGFLLARAADRRREMAIRMAAGATRGTVVRQMMLESLMLALLGGGLGLLVSNWLIQALLRANPPLPFPLNLDIALDWRVLLYTFGASVAAGVFFGLAPALRATAMAIAPTLREESAGSTGGRSTKLRNVLIAGQLALSLLLLVCAGMFIRGMRDALRVDPGFSTAPAGILTVDLRGSGYHPEQYGEMYQKLREAITRIPGVDRLSVSDRLPMTIGNSGTLINVPGLQNDRGTNEFYLETARVSPEYFDVLGVRLRQGEAFRDGQVAGSARVAIVNRATADRFWPGENPVSRTVLVDSVPTTIVGVAENARDRGLTEAPRRLLYTPMLQSFAPVLIFVARGQAPSPRLIDEMRRAALGVDPQLFVVDAKTMDQHLGVMYFLPRMAAWLMSGFALLALALGCIGLYGAVSHAVARRSRELAIRMALGATPGQVVRLVVRSGMVLVAIGGAVGFILALGTAPLLRGFLIGGGSFDAVSFAAVPLLLAVVTLIASWLPARRAARLNPIDAMRAE
jgi:predicted permease